MCAMEEKKLENIVYGDIVMSTKGRDSGTAYLVTGVCGKNTVLASDGKLHRLELPKKKNKKHLKKLCVSEEFRRMTAEAARAEFGADKRLKKLMREAEMLV